MRKIILTLLRNQEKQRNMKQIKLTEEEIDLIESIRNYRKSYPNGYPELRWYIEEMLANMLDVVETDE